VWPGRCSDADESAIAYVAGCAVPFDRRAIQDRLFDPEQWREMIRYRSNAATASLLPMHLSCGIIPVELQPE
jgi:hypothetical protein